MDSLINAAARALSAGDALGALKRVALRDDPPALALRGIAMAQLGEYARARELLRQAARGFGAHDELARARCLVAEAEVALALRELGGTPRTLDSAIAALERHGDRANAVHARLIGVRRAQLLGRLDDALAQLRGLEGAPMAPPLAALAHLAAAELALRALDVGQASAALARADSAARQAGVPALLDEVLTLGASLERPAARLLERGAERPVRLHEVRALLDGGALVLDGCRRGVGAGPAWLALARRPILFALAQTLAGAWPADASRQALIAAAFRVRDPDDTHRARLRVEIGRLRTLLKPFARIEASAAGFILQPLEDRAVALLAPPIDGEQAALVALLADGAAWSTSALALALDASQRTVQRALTELEDAGKVRAVGRGRARRWLAPALTTFTTTLLLPAFLPIR